MLLFFFFKQKTAYEMRISDWSSDVCSSDLRRPSLRDGGTALLRPAALAARGRAAGLSRDRDGLLRGDRRARPGDAARLCHGAGRGAGQLGRESCRESGCQAAEIEVVAG